MISHTCKFCHPRLPVLQAPDSPGLPSQGRILNVQPVFKGETTVVKGFVNKLEDRNCIQRYRSHGRQIRTQIWLHSTQCQNILAHYNFSLIYKLSNIVTYHFFIEKLKHLAKEFPQCLHISQPFLSFPFSHVIIYNINSVISFTYRIFSPGECFICFPAWYFYQLSLLWYCNNYICCSVSLFLCSSVM